MIARTERRRKASDGRPCYLNFGPLSCLNSNFCLQGENFSLSPFICIKEKNILQYYLVFSQASVHASLSVSMCGLFCLLWPLVFFKIFFLSSSGNSLCMLSTLLYGGSNMGNPVGHVKAADVFYVCIFKILCMCQDVHNVINFAVFLVWTT